jgi:electron transport complex protein RnfE
VKGFLKQLKNGILDQNPVLVQLLGMCPTLATTTTVENALGMGLAATAVLICSNIFISLLRKFIPKQVRIAAYIVIISGFVTAVELIMRAYFFSLYQSLGLFIPLIVVNCIILARAEAFASKNPVLPSAVDGLAMGLGFTFALFLLASVREILGMGSWFGIKLLPEALNMTIFILPCGAFLTLGILIAVVQKIRNTSEDKARLRALNASVPKTDKEVDQA